jgi:hypothetical protein
MARQLRKRDFKLGCIHGKVHPKDGQSEHAIQRKLFVSPGIEINWTKSNKERIRLFGYEVPLLAGTARGNCVDLLGYNDDKDLYLIELKKKDSKEKLDKVNKQVSEYHLMIEKVVAYLEKEFQETFFFDIKFQSIKKLVLAPREYFKNQNSNKDPSLIYAHFRDKDITARKSLGYVQVHLQK